MGDKRSISRYAQATNGNGVVVRILMQMCEVGILTHIRFEKVVSRLKKRENLDRVVNFTRARLDQHPVTGCLNS